MLMNASSALRLRPAPARDAAAQRAWRVVHAKATAPYRRGGRFAWHFARGKLGWDPIFRSIMERGLLPQQGRVLDIGCGQGLLASLLQAVRHPEVQAGWPSHWAPPPRIGAYHGIELMPRDVARAQGALAHHPLAARFECADMRDAPLPTCEAVVILDVLHYVDHAAQLTVLQRVRDALVPGGRLLLRVGDAARPRGFAVSQWVDKVVTVGRGHRVPPTWGRTLAEWQGLLCGLGFEVHSLPMSQGTPFANVLLVAERHTEAKVAT